MWQECVHCAETGQILESLEDGKDVYRVYTWYAGRGWIEASKEADSVVKYFPDDDLGKNIGK